MSIAHSERLKHDLTDKYVIVQDGIPELRRFTGLTGQVKTVNMNGRALIQFDGPVDISWYDIDPSYLKIVAAPQPKTTQHAEKPKAAVQAKPIAPRPTAGKSPLELARAQGAGAKAAEADPAKKLSPLELARQQGAAEPATPVKKLSPLELARQQGAAGTEPAVEESMTAEPVAEIASEPVAPPVESVAPPAVRQGGRETPGSTAEILALARQQGPAK